MIYKIGEEIGEVLDHEITPSAAKIRLQINGLEPLTKETVVEFTDGQEALVTLDYKNLKKHCTHCHRLSHGMDNCPGLEQEKVVSATKGNIPPARVPANHFRIMSTNLQGLDPTPETPLRHKPDPPTLKEIRTFAVEELITKISGIATT